MFREVDIKALPQQHQRYHRIFEEKSLKKLNNVEESESFDREGRS